MSSVSTGLGVVLGRRMLPNGPRLNCGASAGERKARPPRGRRRAQSAVRPHVSRD